MAGCKFEFEPILALHNAFKRRLIPRLNKVEEQD